MTHLKTFRVEFHAPDSLDDIELDALLREIEDSPGEDSAEVLLREMAGKIGLTFKRTD